MGSLRPLADPCNKVPCRGIGRALALIGQRQDRVGDNARQAGGVELALVEIEFPGPGLLRHQAPL
jgi:hypothetical protein